SFFSLNNTPPPDIYTLSLHDALPICKVPVGRSGSKYFKTCSMANGWVENSSTIASSSGYRGTARYACRGSAWGAPSGKRLRHVGDRKSTRLNSSHVSISYAVFCLKKK